MNSLSLIIFAVVLAVAGFLFFRFTRVGRPVPDALRRGQPLPVFTAVDEQGVQHSSQDLLGHPAVLLFVRGSWCPFCNRQVSNLTDHYKKIVDLGARLVLITPKPLETTRRVAEYFQVDFEFWLDQDSTVASQLGLLHTAGVPRAQREDYGADTIWPTAVIVDASGVIHYTELSRMIADRPDPESLLRELQALPR